MKSNINATKIMKVATVDYAPQIIVYCPEHLQI